MAHFAYINEDNVVIYGCVVADSDAPTEEAGIAFLGNRDATLGPGRWLQTSINTIEGKHYTFYTANKRRYDGGTGFRENFAQNGMIYDSVRDAFYFPENYHRDASESS